MKFAALCTANDGDKRLLGSFNKVGRSKAGNVAVTNEGIVFFLADDTRTGMADLARVNSQLQIEQGERIHFAVGLAAEGRDTLGAAGTFLSLAKGKLPDIETIAICCAPSGFPPSTQMTGAQNLVDYSLYAASLGTLVWSLKSKIGVGSSYQTSHTPQQLSVAAEEVEKMITRATTPPPGVVQRPGWPLTAAAVRVGQRALSNT